MRELRRSQYIRRIIIICPIFILIRWLKCYSRLGVEWKGVAGDHLQVQLISYMSMLQA